MRIHPLESPHMGKHALNYAQRHRLSVFPVFEPFCGACTCGNPNCDNVGKHPRNAHGVSEATTDSKIIRQWWKQSPEANIGIAATDMIVLDIDVKKQGFVSLEKLETELGKLPATWCADTGGGGKHLFFRRNGVACINGTGLRPGIDMRTSGGYLVASPSLHACGRRYHWSHDSARSLADLPLPWLDFIAQHGKGNEDKPRFDTAGALAGVEEGRRDDTCWKLFCKLKNADVPFTEALELVLKAAANCKPEFAPAIAREKVERAYSRYEPQAPDPKPAEQAAPNEREFHYIEFAPTFLAIEDPPVKYLVNELYPEKVIALSHGDPRTRKSWEAIEVVIAGATGTNAFGMERFNVPSPFPVLYSSQEDTAPLVRVRAKALLKARGIGSFPKMLAFSIHKRINLESHEAVESEKCVDCVTAQ